MKRFIHRENLRLLRDQLAHTIDEEKFQRIVRLIEDEELKYRASADTYRRRRTSVTRDDSDNDRRPAHR